jgi:hypothetical protein
MNKYVCPCGGGFEDPVMDFNEKHEMIQKCPFCAREMKGFFSSLGGVLPSEKPAKKPDVLVLYGSDSCTACKQARDMLGKTPIEWIYQDVNQMQGKKPFVIPQLELEDGRVLQGLGPIAQYVRSQGFSFAVPEQPRPLMPSLSQQQQPPQQENKPCGGCGEQKQNGEKKE